MKSVKLCILHVSLSDTWEIAGQVQKPHFFDIFFPSKMIHDRGLCKRRFSHTEECNWQI